MEIFLMRKNKVNGYIKLFFIALAVAGIIWNTAILHNDVGHLKKAVQEMKEEIKDDIKELRRLIIEK